MTWSFTSARLSRSGGVAEEGRSLDNGVCRFVARYVDDRAILPAE